MMIAAVFGALGTGLKLWLHKDQNKYVDKLTKLQKEYYEEKNKELPDMAVLDNIEFDLRMLELSFSAQVTKPSSQDPS